MEGTYGIYSGENNIGKVKVSREGLYYHFACECRLEKKEVCKICVICGDERIMLGTPIPEGRVFKLHTKVPIKRFPENTPRFYITGSQEMVGEFIPIQPDKPFLHLKDLKNAVMQVRDGVSGILIRK
ncbi:MAG: hypothetical protein IJ388_00575 [Oscillospiraceae bacterium]|nr:hypothetical protein [Oscillospiraceae bacterium]